MDDKIKTDLLWKNLINLRNQQRELPAAALAIFYNQMIPDEPEGFSPLRWINAIKRYMRDEFNYEWPVIIKRDNPHD